MSPITDWEALAKDAKESENKYEPAPQDNYNLTITEVVPAIAESSGNQKFTATMVIDSGPFKGKKLWHDFTVAKGSKNGLRIFFQNMATLGMPFDYFNANTQNEEIVGNMLNKRVSADVIVDTYNPEKPKNKIDKGWTIAAPKGPSELDLPSAAGVPGGASNAAPPPPQQNYQQAPPPQYQQGPPQYQQAPPAQQQQPVYQQPPQQYQEQPARTLNQTEDVDPWQTPSSPPPPPSNANWGAPPPPPPGLHPAQ